MSTRPNVEDTYLDKLSFNELDNLRTLVGKDNKEMQNKISPYEHKQFVRGVVSENPLTAIPMAAMIPAYQASKALGFEKSRSDPSFDQMMLSYQGLGQGLGDYISNASKFLQLLIQR